MIHPLTADPHYVAGEPELSEIPLLMLHNMERATQAIRVISRIVTNCAAEPEAPGGPPLDPAVVSALMGGVECLSGYVLGHIEATLDRALGGAREQ